MNLKKLCWASALVLWMSGFALADAASDAEVAAKADLAKQSQNPVGDIVSVPIEYYHYDGMPNDSSADIVIAKPVYPLGLGKYNLINRFIIPYASIDANIDGSDLGFVNVGSSGFSMDGLGNIQYQGFISPAEPGRIILGLGPVFEFPTHSDSLGSEKWSGGLAAVALSMPGNWVVGGLVQNMWSFAGPGDAADVNKFLFQYFINYNLPRGWYFTMSPAITANWEKDSDNTWTVPFGGGIGKMIKLGKQPVDFKLQGYGYAEAPDNGPDWSVMFAVKFLFPK